MARLPVNGRLAAAIILALLAMTAVATTSVPSADKDPMMSRTLQAWFTAEINATVTDDAGRLLPLALVTMLGNASSWQTNANGYVIISGLDETVGSYSLHANLTGYWNSSDEVVPVYPNQTSSVPLQLIGGTIYGTVTGSSGPIPNATVTVSTLGYTANASQDDGNYSISGVPGGNYSVTALAPGYAPQFKEISLPIGGNVPALFTLYSLNGSISGFAFDTRSNPLNNTNISVKIGLFTTITVLSSADGSYEFPLQLPEGIYTVTASREGFYEGSLGGILVTKGNVTQNKNFTLTEKWTKLYGTVRSGFLVPGVNISIVGTSYYSISGSKGEYSIENVTAGIYTVMAVKMGYNSTTIAGVIIPVGGETRLDIDLSRLPGAVLGGRVVDGSTGGALELVVVTIINEQDEEMVTSTNVDGVFEFTGLVAGNYTIQFKITGYRPNEVRNIHVELNDVIDQTFSMEPLRKGFQGFIFGFDMAHSMMILALFLTIVILAMAVYLRIRTFQAPENAPAVYDQAEEEKGEEEAKAGSDDESQEQKKLRKTKGGGK